MKLVPIGNDIISNFDFSEKIIYGEFNLYTVGAIIDRPLVFTFLSRANNVRPYNLLGDISPINPNLFWVVKQKRRPEVFFFDKNSFIPAIQIALPCLR